MKDLDNLQVVIHGILVSGLILSAVKFGELDKRMKVIERELSAMRFENVLETMPVIGGN